MKEKRKYETPKVEVLEVELSDCIAVDTCRVNKDAKYGIGVVAGRDDSPTDVMNFGGDGNASWDSSTF